MNHLDQLLFEEVKATRRDRVLPQTKTGSPLESGVLRRQIAGSCEDRLRGRSAVEAGPAGNVLLNGMAWFGLNSWNCKDDLRSDCVV